MHRDATGTQPYWFGLTDETSLIFAGLWDHRQGENDSIESATIIVTATNALMRAIHDRIPVILPPASWAMWLDPGQDTETLQGLLKPYDYYDLTCHPVSTAVNNVHNDQPALIQPAKPKSVA